MSSAWLADADSHFYETRDAFTRYLATADAPLGIRVVDSPEGEQIWIGNRRFTFLKPPYAVVPVAGSLREVLRNVSSGTLTETRLEAPLAAEYVERTARLAWMDDHGVELAINVPSLAGTVEVYMEDDAYQTAVNLHAFNRWLDDEWGFAFSGRLFCTPLVSLLDPELAVKEIEFLAERGARVILIRPGPAGRRSPADPVFDSFWGRVAEARILVALHISESGYNRSISALWSEDPHPSAWNISAFQWTCTYGDRPVMDTVAAMVLHNLFGRFPDLQILSLENGSLWVPYLLAAMDKMKGMGRNSPWLGGRVAGRPSDIFRQHVSVSPFHEERVSPLVELIGADRVIFGSDYPHPEGLAEPGDYAEAVRELSSDDQHLILGDNLRALLGVE